MRAIADTVPQKAETTCSSSRADRDSNASAVKEKELFVRFVVKASHSRTTRSA
jgi:hypothetical protein